MSPDGPRTVIRPPPRGDARGAPDDRFAALARPLADLAAGAASSRAPDAAALAAEARARTEAMEAAGLRAGVAAADLAAARAGLWALVDARARSNPALGERAWRRASRRHLPGIAALTPASLAARLAAAEAASKRDLARLLRHCLQVVEATPPPARAVRWGLIGPVALVVVLVAWGGWAEWQFRQRIVAALPEAPSGPVGSAAETAQALDVLAAAVADAAAQSRASPLGLAPRLGRFSPAAEAKARYRAAAARLLPPFLAAGAGDSLARDGGSVALYDTLRTLDMLEGGPGWQAGFVAGWLEDRGGPAAALAPHVSALAAAPGGLPPQDPELRAQARAIAAEGDRAAFAGLELARADAMRALPPLSLTDAVPGIDAALVRRSGLPMSAAMPGRLTAEGWAVAAGGAAATAAARAGAESARLLGTAAPAPGVALVLDQLQRQTIDAWGALVADLRVRPFVDQPTALAVSGALSRRSSPLDALLRLVWREAGGADRSRDHTAQLRVAAAFGPAIRFVESGDSAALAGTFLALNGVLGEPDADPEGGRRQLMDIRTQAASLAALNRAPRLVVQIVEDVLAQAAASRGADEGHPAVRAWAATGAPACRAALEGVYPFAPGPDAGFAAVAGFLGPGGLLARFAAQELEGLLDRETVPWSWKPDAALAGFSPGSAAFVERALQVGAGLFPPGGVMLHLSALAERGAPAVSLGGVTVAVTGSAVADLAWPGPEPAKGAGVRFPAATAPAFREAPGAWGLLHLVDGLRPRARDDGRRFILDVHLGASRAFLDLAFDTPANPVAARLRTAGLVCPPEL